jgi:hypothetical protein
MFKIATIVTWCCHLQAIYSGSSSLNMKCVVLYSLCTKFKTSGHVRSYPKSDTLQPNLISLSENHNVSLAQSCQCSLIEEQKRSLKTKKNYFPIFRTMFTTSQMLRMLVKFYGQQFQGKLCMVVLTCRILKGLCSCK